MVDTNDTANAGTIFVPHIDEFLASEENLRPFEKEIRCRYAKFDKLLKQIDETEGGIDQFTQGYKTFGIHINADNSVSCKEWAPGAFQLYLYGDFNDWDKWATPFERMGNDIWQLHLPANPDGSCPLKHGSQVMVAVENLNRQLLDRLSPWATYAVKPIINKGSAYRQILWNPPEKYRFIHPRPARPKSLRIYECHVGIGTTEPKIGSYKEFIINVIPRIQKLGYNAVQLMGIMEHAYYGSFGYQVTSFFAASSRFGTPEELKELIDAAHAHGLFLLLDIVHAHASKNISDGLNRFDSTNSCYFHRGARGEHRDWGTRIFNYAAWEVLRFLLSNLRWWVDEYHFDGFRFDGVTSMLYHSGGFSGEYKDYFSDSTDIDAVLYLMLANHFLHEFYPDIVTIAEDVSGMPGLCRPVSHGGIGFDYRLGMSIPDKWIQLLRDRRDEDWDIQNLVATLENRRWLEKTIAYAESHDQALVGDKTLAFWLMDKEMYTHMSKLSTPSIIIDRGIALHKMIRLLTHTLGGEGYLNFMGNEFGHPEWLDFPRKDNNESYYYARRQWNLVDDNLLKYSYLNEFDIAMNRLEERYGWLRSYPGYVSTKSDIDKVIVFDRAGLVFVFNFHPATSFTDYLIGVPEFGKYRILLSSDDESFGGFGHLDPRTEYEVLPASFGGRSHSLKVYIPCRTAFILVKVE